MKYKNEDKNYEIESGYEKLPADKAPSNMALFGRFIFSNKIIKEAKKTKTGKDGELWAMDIINSLAQKGDKVIAQPIEGQWHTTGDPLRYLKTSVEFALRRDDIGEQFKKYLEERFQS